MVLQRLVAILCLTAPVVAFVPCKKCRERTHASILCEVTASKSPRRKRWHVNQLYSSTSSEEQNSTPEQLRQASLKRYLQMPEFWASAKRKNKNNAAQKQPLSTTIKSKQSYEKHIQTLHIDHPNRIGKTQKQRSAELIHAAELGNATRLELLMQAGADVNVMDLYHITSLHYAACHGHVEAVDMLLTWGASNSDDVMRKNASIVNDVCGSPLRAAVANGHYDIAAMLTSHPFPFDSDGKTSIVLKDRPPVLTHFNDTVVQQQLFGRDVILKSGLLSIRPSSIQTTKTTVIPVDSGHLGAGSFYIDHAFHCAFIDKLVNLHESLREMIGQQNAMQSTNAARRSHYCDTEGWLCAALDTALQQSKQSQTPLQQSQLPQHFFSHFRFISYLGENGTTSFLAPHKDHSVLDTARGRMSTHTFILYLTTVAEGGETVLLDNLPASKNSSLDSSNSIVQCAIKPVKGRLFVFPHDCPHAGRHVVEGSKLILRGDMS